MKVFMTGGYGFVGSALTRFFIDAGHEVTLLVRSAEKVKQAPAGVSWVVGDPMRPGKWQESVAGHDVLVNLAGATIFRRWTESYKQVVRDSRILTTLNLVEAIPPEAGSGVTLLSTSAVGYYGSTGDEELSEDSPSGSDFLATLGRDWEAEAFKAEEKGVRVAITRFGVVLGKGGGALEQMILPFRFFVGGPLGSGDQWFSWIHVEDLCRAALFVVENPEIRGSVNFASPGPIRNRDLARTIGKVLGRPSWMPAPAVMIRLMLGEFGSVILEGQRVVPSVLLSRGFHFNYPDMESALRNILAA
jgi:uncharacterized protein (TIGR01777 family)